MTGALTGTTLASYPKIYLALYKFKELLFSKAVLYLLRVKVCIGKGTRFVYLDLQYQYFSLILYEYKEIRL